MRVYNIPKQAPRHPDQGPQTDIWYPQIFWDNF